MSAPAYLLVFVEPGDKLSEAEYHDWYDNEHIPLRKDVAGFQAWTRLIQADGQTPTWAAAYELASLETLQSASYTELAVNRSAREKDVLGKLQALDRRIYVLLNEKAAARVGSDDATSLPGPVVLFVSLDVPAEHEDDFHKWYDEEHIPLLAKIPGWHRSRRLILTDAALMGTGGSEYVQKPPRFLAVHDFESEDAFESEEWKKATDTPWRTKVMGNVLARERRVFKVFKRF